MKRLLGLLFICLYLVSCGTDECQTCIVYEEDNILSTDLAAQGFQLAEEFESEEDIVGMVCGGDLDDVKDRAKSENITTPLGLPAIRRTRVECE